MTCFSPVLTGITWPSFKLPFATTADNQPTYPERKSMAINHRSRQTAVRFLALVHHSAFVSRVFIGKRLHACYCQKRNRNSKSVDICASRYPAAVCQPDSWIRERMGPKTAKVALKPRPSGSESTTRPEMAKENMMCL